MRLIDCLNAKYSSNCYDLLKREAKHLVIPYPLEDGWVKKYGDMEITADKKRALKKELEKISALADKHALNPWKYQRSLTARKAIEYLDSIH